MSSLRHIIGIDEVGRGPLAGPVMVCAVVVPTDFDWEQLLPGVGDSKKVTSKNREAVFAQAEILRKNGQLDYCIASQSAATIDKKGIVSAVNTALIQALATICKRGALNPLQVQVKLDGSLRAPAMFVHQETIIKGDAKEQVIGLASIIAKVTRDRHMEMLGSDPAYTPYGFLRHKGYGTKMHREAIVINGLSLEHRVSFCKNIKTVS